MIYVRSYEMYAEEKFGVEALQVYLEESDADCFGISLMNEGAIMRLYPANSADIPNGALDSYVDAERASANIKWFLKAS